MAGRLRRRLCAPSVTRRRKPVQALHRPLVLSAARHHDVGDFRLIDRKVLDVLRRMPEQDRFVRGMIAWLGFRQTEVAFHRLERAAGETKYPLFKMTRLAVSGVLGFSDAPLRLAIWCGLAVSGLAVLYGCWVLVLWMSNDSRLVAGWSSTIVII